jgi:hypothetical protein
MLLELNLEFNGRVFPPFSNLVVMYFDFVT